jgi:cephalosporin hydroxylase
MQERLYQLRGRVRLRTRLRQLIATRGPRRNTIDSFHRLYYDSEDRTWGQTLWLGTRVLKLPLDLWIYQEMLWELKPGLIIECGTAHGGSAYFLASICDLIGRGKVLTIDVIENPGRPAHPRITYLLGSSTSDAIVQQVRSLARNEQPIMVILDSDHSKAHVLNELRLYSDLVTEGSYLVVEDTNINGHPAHPTFGPGPMEALEEFLKTDQRFVVDRSREKLLLTFNPRGYLRRKGAEAGAPAARPR